MGKALLWSLAGLGTVVAISAIWAAIENASWRIANEIDWQGL